MQKLHYYAFSFSGSNGSVAWVAIGYSDQKVTGPRVNRAKELAGVPPDSVLIGLGYMGHMTSDEMRTLS